MQLFKKIATTAAVSLALLLVVSPAKAQSALPKVHNDTHNGLIANQNTKLDLNKIKHDAFSKKADGVEMTEEDAALFNYNWNSQTIATAYAGLTVPLNKDIDVTGYVAPVKGKLVSAFGYRPRFGRMHRGVDLDLNVGDTVVAAFDGRVRITKFERRGYGYYVVLRHDNGLETVYGHLSRFLVKPDQYVKAGQPIALGGNTGRSTGPHLHFETRFMGIALNPASIIDFENYVTHKDVYTFDKQSSEKANKQYGKDNKKSKKSKATAKKKSSKKKGKATASKSKKNKK